MALGNATCCGVFYCIGLFFIYYRLAFFSVKNIRIYNMNLKKDKLNYFLFGFCLAIVGRAAGSFMVGNPSARVADFEDDKVRTVQQDASAWRDTLFVLSAQPSASGPGHDVVFVNKNGVKQMVRSMRDNVVVVDSGDVVVIDESCNVVKRLARGKKLESFVKQK